MRSEIRPFELWDTNDHVVKESYQNLLKKKETFIFTWELGNTPMAYFGIQYLTFGTGMVWVKLNQEAIENMIKTVKATDYIINTVCPQHLGLHKLQAVVREEDTKANKFAQFFGFEKEGLLKNYSYDKLNYNLYGRSVWFQ